MGRKKEESADLDGPPSYEDDINESVVLYSVGGRDLAEVIAHAKELAAKAFATRPENIYVKHNSDLVAAAKQRFGDDPAPIMWKATVSCGLVPEHLRLG